MNKLWIFSVFIVLTELGMAGCQPETNFRAYKDQKNKGEQIFLKDMQACQDIANQSSKRSEGSEGAGERLNRKHSLYQICMESKNWTLKK
ncbi:MAG: hypothetical protein O3A78_04750 [Nitrospinae bacterium]|jgi:hypothetical protein|nr:hypothetical protein [Nitrospinota bacterium]MDA1109113.1 hypothetical protein [Nitrospinota bacterium]